MNEKRLKLYLDLALERQRIWNKKRIGVEKPWTENKIFQQYFFTNVFRDQDKVSQWIMQNICELSDPRMWGFMMVYRYIGRIEIFNEICNKLVALPKNQDWNEFKDYLLEKEKRNEKIVTGAYIVNSAGTMRKMEYIFAIVEKIAEEHEIIEDAWRDNSIERATEFFKAYPGIAGFMGYEYATDLTYCKCYLPEATDRFKWANLGPGCNRGINLLLGESNLEKKVKDHLCHMGYIMGQWRKYFTDRRFDSEPKEVIDRLRNPVMRDVEHWLCEFSKYAKYSSYASTSNGVTFKHRKYPGRP